jgi:hypothetical protein
VGLSRGAELANGYRKASDNKESDKRLGNYRQYRGLRVAIVKDCVCRRRGGNGPRRYVKHPNDDSHPDRKNGDNE